MDNFKTRAGEDMEVISIVNQKGGVGKTTTAVNLGAGLTRLGYKVLLIDLDAQCNLTLNLNVSDQEAGTSFQLLTIGTGSVISTSSGDLIPGSRKLASVGTVIPQLFKSGWQAVLARSIEQFKNRYDFIIIDTAPSLGLSTINALVASTACVITAECDMNSYYGINQVLDTISSCRKYNHCLKVAGILLCKYRSRTILCRDMHINIKALARQHNVNVYQTVIKESNLIRESQALRRSILEYKPKCAVASDYMDWINEFLRKEGM